MGSPDRDDGRKKHINDERTVHCPVENCDATPLARGAHLHILRSAGDGHGDQNEIPDWIDLDDLEEAGTKEVQMDYPETREKEDDMRLCPYCERPYKGVTGVLIHLGQVKGRKDHPSVLPDSLNPMGFSVVEVDDHDNIVEVVEEGGAMPSTTKRREREEGESGEDIPNRVENYLQKLRDEGRDEEAEEAEQMLLD